MPEYTASQFIRQRCGVTTLLQTLGGMSSEMVTENSVLWAAALHKLFYAPIFVFFVRIGLTSPETSHSPQNNETHILNSMCGMKHFESGAAYTHRTKNTAPHNCSACKIQIEF